jgi:hypothetical protein
VVNTDSSNITSEGGNCFEYTDEPKAVGEFRLSKIRKRYADYILEGKKVFFERISLEYFERGISSLVLAFVDRVTKGVAKVNEYTVGLYFLIPVVIFVSIMFMYILHVLQDIHYALAGKVFIEGIAGDQE